MYKIVNLNEAELDVEGKSLQHGASVYVKELSEKTLLLYKAGLVLISTVVKAEEPKSKSESKLTRLVRDGHPLPFLDYSANTHRLKQD